MNFSEILGSLRSTIEISRKRILGPERERPAHHFLSLPDREGGGFVRALVSTGTADNNGINWSHERED